MQSFMGLRGRWEVCYGAPGSWQGPLLKHGLPGQLQPGVGAHPCGPGGRRLHCGSPGVWPRGPLQSAELPTLSARTSRGRPRCPYPSNPKRSRAPRLERGGCGAHCWISNENTAQLGWSISQNAPGQNDGPMA